MNSYSAVSIRSTTGVRLKRLLSKHKNDYHSIMSFVDHAVCKFMDEIELQDKAKLDINSTQLKDTTKELI